MVIRLIILGLVACAATSHVRLPERWSDPATWGGHIPALGEDATIGPGRRVVLDVSPPGLRYLRIDGDLTFDGGDRILAARAILVHGRLTVGSDSEPYRGRARIVTGPERADSSIDGGVHVAGRLDVYGEPNRQSWTRLDGSVAPGATSLRVEGPTGWRVGDEIAIGSTGMDPTETERRTIVGIESRTVRLDQELRHMHIGRNERGVEMRAVVALLTRNVAFASVGSGGNVMAMSGASMHLQDAEFAGMGQKGRLGRYPIHFHHAGEARGSFVRGCVVREGENRGIVLHDTAGVVLSDNVVCGALGHAFFIEDGVETDNLLMRNVALDIRAPASRDRLLPSDAVPSGFWITNPRNDLVANVAQGVEGHGFWYALVPEARRLPLGRMTGNQAQSIGRTGLMVDGEANPPGTYGAPNYDPPSTARFAAQTSVACGGRGLWLRGSRLRVEGARVAGCSIGATLAASRSEFVGGLLLGRTRALGPAIKPTNPRFPVRGFEMYDGPVAVRDTTFVGYREEAGRTASALAYLRFTPFFVHPRNEVSGLRFEDALPIRFERMTGVGGDGYRSALLVDRDGSLTGLAGASVTAPSPILSVKNATYRKPWDALVTPGGYGRLFVDFPGTAPVGVGGVRLTRDDGKSLVLAGQPFEGRAASYQSTVPIGREFVVRTKHRTTSAIRLTFRFAAPGEQVEIRLPTGMGRYMVSGIAPSEWSRERGAIRLRLRVEPCHDARTATLQPLS